MVTIHIKKTSDFDVKPEFEIPRQSFHSLEALIASSPDSPIINYLPATFRGSYLSGTAATIKVNNLSARKFEETQKADEGNVILETKISLHPNVLLIYINLQELGVLEGRGSYEIKPTQNGFWLRAMEVDYYKNSQNEEAHAVQRTILRNYSVNGQYDWQNLRHGLMPDGSLQITVGPVTHPGLAFPLINQGPVYSSLAGYPGFPTLDLTQTFGKFAGSGDLCRRCCRCGGVKTVGLQTGSSLCNVPMESWLSVQTQTSLQQMPSSMVPSVPSLESSWFFCSCDSMDY